jgi:hypothetical protein
MQPPATNLGSGFRSLNLYGSAKVALAAQCLPARLTRVTTAKNRPQTSGVLPGSAGFGSGSFMSHVSFSGIVASLDFMAKSQLTSLPV